MDRLEKTAFILNLSLKDAEKVINDDLIIDSGGRCDWEPSIEEEKRLRKLGKVNVRNYKNNELIQIFGTVRRDK